jgi:hypothetical protein
VSRFVFTVVCAVYVGLVLCSGIVVMITDVVDMLGNITLLLVLSVLFIIMVSFVSCRQCLLFMDIEDVCLFSLVLSTMEVSLVLC